MAPSVSVTQQLSDLTEFIKAYKCRVYSCVTSPHERCIESIVPVRLASLRACTLPWRAPTRPSAASRSASPPVERDPELSVRKVYVEPQLPHLLRREGMALRHIYPQTSLDKVRFNFRGEPDTLPKPFAMSKNSSR